MEDLLREVEIAVSYHAKSTIDKYDILLGDDKLLGLIIDNLGKKYEYDALHDKVQAIIDQKLCKLHPQGYNSSQDELVSSETVDYKINNAIVQILNQIDNQFVRSELKRVALAPKKMLRAKMFLKMNNNQNYEYAALIELFHLATLIQDDVIDVATTRRHVQTINSKFDDRIAILISDYLLVHIGYMIGKMGRDNDSKAKSTSKEIQNYYQNLIKDFLKSLLYSEREVTTVSDIKSYETYANNKTAKFFKVALISGVMSSDQELTLELIEAVGEFGIQFGLIFQKVDDLLDYQADVEVSGKDSRDADNEVNNFVLLSLKSSQIEQVKAILRTEANQLLNSKYGYDFEDEIENLIRRINE